MPCRRKKLRVPIPAILRSWQERGIAGLRPRVPEGHCLPRRPHFLSATDTPRQTAGLRIALRYCSRRKLQGGQDAIARGGIAGYSYGCRGCLETCAVRQKKSRKRGLRKAGRPRTRRRRSRSAGRIAAPELQQLVADIGAPDPRARAEAVKQLGQIVAATGTPASAEVASSLLERMGDVDASVRLAAALTLTKLPDASLAHDACIKRLDVEADRKVRAVLISTAKKLTNLPEGHKVSAVQTENHESATDGMPVNQQLASSGTGNGRREDVSSSMADAMSIYRRELPLLLERHRGKWAAYSSTRRLALDADHARVYQRCCELGLVEGQFVLCRVEPEVSTDLII